MSAITFIGAGPSPRDISLLYRPEQELPQFKERYDGEYGDMYRANGLRIIRGLWVVGEGHTFGQMIADDEPVVPQPEELPTYLGPLIIESKIIKGGVAWWQERKRTAAGNELSITA